MFDEESMLLFVSSPLGRSGLALRTCVLVVFEEGGEAMVANWSPSSFSCSCWLLQKKSLTKKICFDEGVFTKKNNNNNNNKFLSLVFFFFFKGKITQQ
jgi:hypothetical protein